MTIRPLISFVGETAMAGAVAGGIKNVAIAYGFNCYNHDVTILATNIFDYLYNPVLGRFLDQEIKS